MSTPAIKPLLPLSPSFNHPSRSPISWSFCRPISDSSPFCSIFTSSRQRRQVSASVAFNPSGKFDLSLQDDEDAEPKQFLERTIGFTINYTREDPHDRRELSEYPDIRLWFVRLDSEYPWLPVLLDWRAGELARYAAMLVPHQISMRMGIVFNPEALELFVMKKVFIVYSWLKQHDIPKPRLKTANMARMLGFGIGDELFDLIDQHPVAPP
ncbi:protein CHLORORESPIRATORY REDUCTION 6, chloroplastic isoform X2 [Cucurbita moschata]|uniref:Protein CHLORORESPIRATORY REDUCTION 6, chloroplastic isoform X2 n=1 Tax=Cucurbita moschata TaxID=3662 RepID=A0A6J1E567_CUCMO|nr:protein CHLORORESPIRATORY REDUCTION 6, chloroplastic isoform X2 [Cucurbita moschata]